MKSLTPAYLAHVSGEVTTLATCWKCTLKDGTVLGFTDHVTDLTIAGVDYLSASGYTPSSIESSSQFNVDNLEVQAILDNDIIQEADLLAGRWDFAEVSIFRVNYEDLSMGTDIERVGRIGEVKLGRSSFVAELRGMLQAYTKTLGELYSPTCRASLGDTRCKINLAAWTVSGSVTGVTSNSIFTAASLTQAADWFNYGKLTWTSGPNDGYAMEVKDFGAGLVTLCLPMPFAIGVGDTFSLSRGCDRSFGQCKSVFSNGINFRGEPHLPGIDKILAQGRSE